MRVWPVIGKKTGTAFTLRTAAKDIFTDFVSFFGKLLFIFCHNIANAHHGVVVQIISDLCDLKYALADFFHSKVKQSSVICFKLDRSALYKDQVIAAQIFGRRKAPSGVPFFRPRIGKIEIDLSISPSAK